MKHFLPTIISLAVLSLPQVAIANSATVSYANMDIAGLSFNGIDIKGSLKLSDHISLDIENRSVHGDNSGSNITYEDIMLSVNYTTSLNKEVDAKFILGGRNQNMTRNWDGYAKSRDDSSTIYGVGVESTVNDKINLSIDFIKSMEAGSSVMTRLGANFAVAENMTVAVSATNEGQSKSVSVGMQSNF